MNDDQKFLTHILSEIYDYMKRKKEEEIKIVDEVLTDDRKYAVLNCIKVNEESRVLIIDGYGSTDILP